MSSNIKISINKYYLFAFGKVGGGKRGSTAILNTLSMI